MGGGGLANGSRGLVSLSTELLQEGSQYVNGFGGVGGFLRYRVDFQALEYDPGMDELGDLDLDDYM